MKANCLNGKSTATRSTILPPQIGDSDFYADLVLYNIKIHAYIVVELKATPFKPEYAGQLKFYINVVEEELTMLLDNEKNRQK